MYYYLFESTQNQAAKKWQQRFKEKLTTSGIGGEFVSPSPARTIDELMQMGIDKGYSTTVAIGSDLFINKVASSVIFHSLKRKKDRVVFGAVYSDRNASYFKNYVHITGDDEAIDVLKARHLSPIPVGYITPNKFFISPVFIHRSDEFSCTLVTESYSASITTTSISLEPTGILTAAPRVQTGGVWRGLKRLFQRPRSDEDQTTFIVKAGELKSSEPLPVELEGEVIAKTPVVFQAIPRVLHFIINRDKVEPYPNPES